MLTCLTTEVDLYSKDAFQQHEFARTDLFIPTVIQRIGRRVFQGSGQVRVVVGASLSKATVEPPYANERPFLMAIEQLSVTRAGVMWHGFPIIIFRVHKDLPDHLTRQLRERRPTDWLQPTRLPIDIVSYNPTDGRLVYVENLRRGTAEYRYTPNDPVMEANWNYLIYYVPGRDHEPEIPNTTSILGCMFVGSGNKAKQPAEDIGPTRSKRLKCKYRAAFEYAKRMGIADLNMLHAEFKTAHAPTYGLVRPFREQARFPGNSPSPSPRYIAIYPGCRPTLVVLPCYGIHPGLISPPCAIVAGERERTIAHLDRDHPPGGDARGI